MGKSLKEYDREEKAKKAVNAIVFAIIAYYIFRFIAKPLKIKWFRISVLILYLVFLIYSITFDNGLLGIFVVVTLLLDISNFRVNPSLVPKFKIIGLSIFVLLCISIFIFDDPPKLISLPLMFSSFYLLGLYLAGNMYQLYLADNPVGKPIKNFWTGKIKTLGEPLEYERFIVVQFSTIFSFLILLGTLMTLAE
ncbi:MAG: hypothetical protein CMC48_06460 [Flavobacteriaceae bacterium]|nr:hypothetical protein [Flavobacteriaceae bacterium]|tara:strand:+ start:6742 stop:7323 length:582 start_codon:yes stop_codon:yes gene_type:complete